MEASSRIFFQRAKLDPANQVCIDFGTEMAQWASVTHGCYISLEASGVHRSLGVHISFVRSTTMDSWKPQQLRAMELGGNARLNKFFREHGVADDLPIAQKYNTRAADWYRRNLKSEIEGQEPPPPLEKGTGHLLVDGALSSAQIAFGKAAAASTTASPGGASAADARHYGSGQPSSDSSPNASPRPQGSENTKRVDDCCKDSKDGDEDDVLTGIFGQDVGQKVSSSVWSTIGFVGGLANRAKAYADAKATQAAKDGWLDTAKDVAKESVDTASKTTVWAAQRGAEAIDQAKLSEAAAKTSAWAAQRSAEVESSVNWVAEQVGVTSARDSSIGLSKMSTGTMQSFSSDCPVPSGQRAPEEPRVVEKLCPPVQSGPEISAFFAPPSRSINGDPSEFVDTAKDGAPPSGSKKEAPRPTSIDPFAAPDVEPTAPSKKVADLWKDDNWDSFK